MRQTTLCHSLVATSCQSWEPQGRVGASFTSRRIIDLLSRPSAARNTSSFARSCIHIMRYLLTFFSSFFFCFFIIFFCFYLFIYLFIYLLLQYRFSLHFTFLSLVCDQQSKHSNIPLLWTTSCETLEWTQNSLRGHGQCLSSKQGYSRNL
jgi:hypothetical protein